MNNSGEKRKFKFTIFVLIYFLRKIVGTHEFHWEEVVFICFRIRMRIILAIICALLMFWTRKSTAQSETQSNDYLQVYDEEDYGENPQNEVFRNKGKNLDLYDRYRIRRQFRPQRFGKRHMGFTPQRFGKRTHERMNL
ncbi:unnamed protein product [Heterobilharzia americana]|nr:unnamed protein product [Heterobilharzia americana]